jgi:Ca-activated chloride channel family protein
MLSSAIRSMTIPIASLTAALSAVPAVVPASIAAAQGMVIPRAGLCVAPMVCSTGCPAPNCIPVIGPAVARTSSQVEATLADRVIHYEVTETFINRGPRLAEADYVFPLPAGAAFQDLQLSINGELVAGEALNANDARGVYEEIVRRLRDPALVEWMGTGMLRARIFPIAPGEVKKVVVRFQTVAPREGDAIRIDYAGAGAPDPRATGGTPVGYLLDQTAIRRAGSGGRGGGADDGSDRTSGSYFTLTYRAADGFGTPYSPTHALTAAHDGDRQSVRIDGSARDITILLPITHTSSAAVTMLPYATGDGPGFALITVAPPAVHVAPTPRDLTFVLDVSGSMSGRKLEQARAAGRQMLGTLTSRDRFRLIDFSTDVRTFRDRFETATPDHIREAEQYLDQLEAEGSTNIEAALRAALTVPAEDDGTPSDASRLPLTLFITDGEPTIGQRDAPALVAQAVSVLGRTRLFTFGLGADVNSSLLEQLALQGHGTAQFVRPDESVERAVSLVASRLTNPVITDVAVDADGVRLTRILPGLPVDLFAGQDLVLLARYQGSGPTKLRFTGRTANGPVSWASTVTFPERERANPFVARLWATQQIGYLEAERHRVGATPELDAELASLGERYGIPTELTSYLVREPTATASTQPLPAAPTNVGPLGARDGQADMVMRKSNAAAGYTGANAPAREAYLDAKQASAQRGAVTLASADSASMSAGSVAGVVGSGGRAAGTSVPMDGVRHVGEWTFVKQDSVWTDTRYKQTAGLRVVRVQAYSDAYFALARLVPDLRDAFAVGDRVLVTGKAIAVEVTPAGETRLSDADVAAVRAGW